jgi:hypothetical protein
MTANLNMRNVQESVEDTSKVVMEYGRKAYLAYLGAWGMGYDGLKAVYKHPKVWVDKAEKRGKVVEKDLMKVFQAYQQDFPGEVAKLAEKAQSGAGDLYKSAESYAEDFAKKAEKTFAQVVRRNPEVAAVVEDIAVDAKAATKSVTVGARKAVDSVATDVEAVVESAVEAIWKGYDELGVKDIVAGLDNMDMKRLEELRKYEAGSKNRVTVMREIDARMQALTS